MASNKSNKPIRSLFELRALPHAAVALAAVGASGSAMAQSDPVAGRTLYESVFAIPGAGNVACRDCHGPVLQFRAAQGTNEATIVARINGAIGRAGTMMGGYASWTTQQRADVAAYIARGIPPSPPPAGTPPSPVVMPASPSALMFPATAVGSASAVMTFTMMNMSASTITMGANAISPVLGDPSEFRFTTPTSGTACPVSNGMLAAGASCVYAFQFVPSGSGTRKATSSINFANNVPSVLINFEGTASGGSPSPTPTPTPTPTPSPTPSPSAAPAASGGGGAFAWFSLFGLLGALIVRAPRRRVR